MHNKFLIGAVLVILALGTQSFDGQSQNNYSKLDHLTVDDGLSSNRIWAIHRDSKDYLWMSTDLGLDKYDSYEVKKYRYDENQPGTISSNNIISIYEDQKKNLWFGTIDGLNLYDPSKDNFKVFKKNPDDKNSINSNYINSFIEDKKGNLWIVTDGNFLNKWIPKTQNFIQYQFETKTYDLYARPSKMIGMDSKGYLWLVSFGHGVHRFDPETGKFTKFDDLSVDFGSDCHKSLYIDNQDKIWITTDGNGFFSYDIGSNKFEQFGSKGDSKGTNQKIILDILPEDEHHLLLAVDQGGINRFDKVSKSFEYILSDQTNGDGLNNNGIWCFHKDKEGILWIGTSGGGINYYNPKKAKFKLFRHNSNNPKSLSYNFTGCFFEDYQGSIWIGTDGGGINVYDPITGNFTIYKHNPSNPNSISGNVIRSIAEDKDHNVWIGTWDSGLNMYERKTGKFHHYLPDNNNQSSISSRTIWNLAIDKNDNLWLANYVVGTDLMDKNKGVIKKFRKNPNDSSSISSNQTYLFYEDSEKNMWVCTQDGLNLYDSKTNSFKVYNFPDNVIGAFYKDIEGNLWVGSNTKGIYYCKPDGTIIKTFDTSNGLPNNRIQAIVEDNHNNLWISTSGGISQFDPKTQIFRNYTKEDGLQGNQFFQQSFLKTRKGEIYFGGYNGFNAFYPDSLKDNELTPKIYITDFQIFNKSVRFGIPGAQFQTQISEAKEITLNWNQSVFSFSFAAINYTNSRKNKYAYIMEGFEKEWNYTNSSRRYVNYTNLDPGKYIFRIKASNNDGVWNENGISLEITILPPWWKTLWFKIVVLLLIVLVLYLAYYLKLKLFQKKQKELSILVDIRTQEITSANKVLLERQIQIERQSSELRTHADNLKEANNLLVQKQSLIKSQTDTIQEANNKLTKLNLTKSRIFSIIAHDLRNPFNAVSGFSELLLEDYQTLPPETIEMYLNLINQSSKNGNFLLGNLLQWSRNQTGSIAFEPVRLNLLLVVKETFNFLKGSAQKKKINIKLQVDPNAIVEADENMLKTILRNLLSNAIKFTSENGNITIDSSLKVDHVEVRISDSGVGIRKEKIPMLFNIETNSSTNGTSQESGTGLGLILCKEFVDKHRGKIWVETQEGIGSHFIFTLPLIS